ncbi:hypothetical protein FXO37_05447 [Capsicum annuum]|nr:hypothetical protein FXO37_05447 [Capsicum annuum]
MEILHKVDAKIGILLKIDTCTSTTYRGRYARLCVQQPHCPAEKRRADFQRYVKSPSGPSRVNGPSIKCVSQVTGLNLSPPTGPGKSSLPSDLKIPYNDPYAPKFPTNDSNTIPLNDELSKVGSTKLNSSIPNLSHLKDLKIHESPLFLTNTMAPPDSQLKADRPQMDFMHENKNSLHINSAVNNSDVHPYNDYTARDDSDMLNSQNSPSPIHFTKSHVSEHTPFPAINHGSFSNLPIQGSAYPSQPTLPSSSTIPEIYSDGTREQSFPLLNLHINESYSSLYTPIMAGGGTHGTCTNLHHGSEWSGMSCTDSKLSGPSANHNGGNGERN